MNLGRFCGAWLGLVAVLPMCDAGGSDSGSGAEAGEGGTEPGGVIPSNGGSESTPGGAGGVGHVPLPHAGGAGGQAGNAGGGVPQGGSVSGGEGGGACVPILDPKACCGNMPSCDENWDMECSHPDGVASCCDVDKGERVFCTSDTTVVVPCVDKCTGKGLGTGACHECYGDAAECPDFEGLGGYPGSTLDSYGCGDATTCKNSGAGYRLNCTENSVAVACTCDADATQ